MKTSYVVFAVMLLVAAGILIYSYYKSTGAYPWNPPSTPTPMPTPTQPTPTPTQSPTPTPTPPTGGKVEYVSASFSANNGQQI